jgi:hypothetical protein
MNQHFSEADLLETYYTQPGDSLPVMLHLAECEPCAARYERLERKLRGLAACETEKPEFFWARQRALIMRRLPSQQTSNGLGRLAAAAMLAFVISATFTRPIADQQPLRPPVRPVTIPQDPWESDTLEDYQPLVEWESWVEDGGQS